MIYTRKEIYLIIKLDPQQGVAPERNLAIEQNYFTGNTPFSEWFNSPFWDILKKMVPTNFLLHILLLVDNTFSPGKFRLRSLPAEGRGHAYLQRILSWILSTAR